jgi:hypothetical protein
LTDYVATRWYRAPELLLSWKDYTATGIIFIVKINKKWTSGQLGVSLQSCSEGSLSFRAWIRKTRLNSYLKSSALLQKQNSTLFLEKSIEYSRNLSRKDQEK